MATQSGSTQKMTVLLAGVGARCAPMLNDYLRKRGCEIALASSRKEVQRMLRERRYDPVLNEFMHPDGTAYQLMSCLRGADTTIFFSVCSNTAAGSTHLVTSVQALAEWRLRKELPTAALYRGLVNLVGLIPSFVSRHG